ncbi:Sorting nexin-3 [Coemansia sp. RSA 2671]|nr:Sorting nexin-3 [Coemansia sp. RSA 2675]KAJ2032583.1 Sorting nexin-3 [Coemansia sp. S610]KAJ2349314.1 Sorting nexin-3 [Coemansia sp. RSA 2671]
MPRPSRAFDNTTRLRPNDQSLDDQYGEPENFLEISVSMPVIREVKNKRYAEYEIECFTNIPLFKLKHSKVKRRYSDFVWLRDKLERESTRVNLPPLPPKVIYQSLATDVLKLRQEKLQMFLQIIAGHPLLQTGSKVLIPFIQDSNFNRDAYEM